MFETAASGVGSLLRVRIIREFPVDDWVKVGQIAESFATVLALIVGGFWTYSKFFRSRTNCPIIDPSVSPSKAHIDGGWMIHVEVRIRNLGQGLAKMGDAELRLRQVVPMPDEIESAVRDGYDPVADGESQILWPSLAQRNWNADAISFEIEPGESGSLHADFFVQDEVQMVEFYFFLKNPKKSKKRVGWAHTCRMNLNTVEEGSCGDG